MKPIFAVLAALALLLAGCQGTLTLPALPTPSPTLTATLVPTPTPTREDEVVIPFETIAVNELIGTPPVGGEPEIVTNFTPRLSWEEVEKLIDQGPATFLLTAPEDVTLIQGWLPPETLTAIANVDFEQHAVVAFFAGVKGGGSDGYIERIAIDRQETVNVYAVLRQRSSGTTNETYPSHIVKIQRQDVPFPLSADTQVTLVLQPQISERGSNRR